MSDNQPTTAMLDAIRRGKKRHGKPPSEVYGEQGSLTITVTAKHLETLVLLAEIALESGVADDDYFEALRLHEEDVSLNEVRKQDAHDAVRKGFQLLQGK